MDNSAVVQKPSESDHDHDLLSFLSVIFHEYATFNLNYTLLGVVLNESSFDMRSVGAGGAYFSVYKASGKSLLDQRTFSPIFSGTENSFPELVAIKSPIIKGETNSRKNRKIWTALAQEVMILRHVHLIEHDNVVSLLGVCWHQPGTETFSIMPALVLEAAENDLEAFMMPGKGVEGRKLVGLAIDIVAGVRAVHDCDIAHCDIKPKNILICKHPELGYTAKVADFGCAILLSTIKDKVMPPGATEFWRAPECSQPLSGEGLKQADMYSTALIVWNLLTANFAVTALEESIAKGISFVNDATDEVEAKQALLYLLISETVNLTWDFPTKDHGSETEIEAPKKHDLENILASSLVLKPAGRSLSDFRDIPELLCAFRDAIKAHRSRLIHGEILHRDMSSNYIIITDSGEADGHPSVLIDMDFAMIVDKDFQNDRALSQCMAGILEYMPLRWSESLFEIRIPSLNIRFDLYAVLFRNSYAKETHVNQNKSCVG